MGIGNTTQNILQKKLKTYGHGPEKIYRDLNTYVSGTLEDEENILA